MAAGMVWDSRGLAWDEGFTNFLRRPLFPLRSKSSTPWCGDPRVWLGVRASPISRGVRCFLRESNPAYCGVGVPECGLGCGIRLFEASVAFSRAIHTLPCPQPGTLSVPCLSLPSRMTRESRPSILLPCQTRPCPPPDALSLPSIQLRLWSLRFPAHPQLTRPIPRIPADAPHPKDPHPKDQQLTSRAASHLALIARARAMPDRCPLYQRPSYHAPACCVAPRNLPSASPWSFWRLHERCISPPPPAFLQVPCQPPDRQAPCLSGIRLSRRFQACKKQKKKRLLFLQGCKG